MRHKTLNSLLATLITGAFLWACPAIAQTSYNYYDLGTLGGTTSSSAGVNNAGQVVGATTLASGATHPFYWSSATGMVDIGTFGGTSGGAKGINNVGDVVGHATNVANVWHPFVWNISTHVLTDLNSLLSQTDAAKWTLTYAWKINDNRQVIGQGTVTIGGLKYSHAYLLDLNTSTLTDLGAFQPIGINSVPPPQVVGGQSGVAYLYSGGSLMTLASFTSAKAINNAGEIVGYLPNAHAAYRSPSGQITDLGYWGAPYGVASANSINNAASPMVVGDSDIVIKGSYVKHAFRWIVGSTPGMQDLNSLTLNLGKTSYLSLASNVSDTGYIVGSTGNSHAFLLTPQ